MMELELTDEGNAGSSSYVDDYVANNQIAIRLKTISRTRLGIKALGAFSRYDIYLGGMAFSPGSVLTALRTSPRELRRDENELIYIIERLNRIEGIYLSSETWRSYTEAWEALLMLRKKILVQRGHAIIACIASDLSVIEGLGAAKQVIKIAGNVPQKVLHLLNEGPVQHLHRHAFQYRTIIDKEIFAIQRVKEIQKGFKAMISGTLVALAIGFSNQLFAILFSILFPDEITN